MDKLHLRDPGHNPTSSELPFWEDLTQKKVNLVLQRWSNACIEETPATQFEIPTNPVYHPKEVVPVGERKWNDIPACKAFKGDSLQAEV